MAIEAVSDIVRGGLSAFAAAGAPLDSPTFTGVPTAPTAALQTNTTQVATTAFVLASLILDADNNKWASIFDVAAVKVSPTFTGTPLAPIVAYGSGVSGQIATQSYVLSAFSASIDVSRPKALSGFCGGKPAANEVVGGAIAPYALTLSAANSLAIATVAATSSTVFTIKNGASSIGTITFSAAATAGVVAYSATSITTGQNVTIVAPATPDATLSDITFLLKA